MRRDRRPQPKAAAPVIRSKRKERIMSKPPQTTPHSDLDGVHEDEKPNVGAALESGEDAGDHIAV